MFGETDFYRYFKDTLFAMSFDVSEQEVQHFLHASLLHIRNIGERMDAIPTPPRIASASKAPGLRFRPAPLNRSAFRRIQAQATRGGQR